MELSKHQQAVMTSILDWYHTQKDTRQQFVKLGGYAGTGKTTLLAYLRAQLHKRYPQRRVVFVSFTGKATMVLNDKLRTHTAKFPGDKVSTIHRLIYSPVMDDGEIIAWQKRDIENLDFDLIILDEASMVTSDIWRDLTSLGVPILAVGDHGQLPPIGGNFNLMEEPDLILEEIYRQQEQNPILQLSQMARTEGVIPHGEYGPSVRKLNRGDSDTWEVVEDLFRQHDPDMLILTGYNHTRNRINAHIRSLLEFESPSPLRRDRVICLKNNHSRQILNGMLGYVLEVEQDEDGKMELEVLFDGEDKVYRGVVNPEQFGAKSTLSHIPDVDQFDFGYAITVHKAQGSQANTVVLFEERFAKMTDEDWKRWLYTAVTRATENLYIIG